MKFRQKTDFAYLLKLFFLSAVIYFFMPLSNIYAEIRVISPVDESYTENSILKIVGAEDNEGSHEEKNEITISVKGKLNGEPDVYTEEVRLYDSEFSLEVELYDGENVINIGKKTFTVYYKSENITSPVPERFKKFNYHNIVFSGCYYCHDTIEDGLPLVTEKTKICNECHPQYINIDIIRSKEKAERAGDKGEILFENLHKPVFEGKCLMCHMPHSSPNRRLLTKERVSFLCEECHKEIFDAINLAKKPHPPQRDGECVMCHSPHASTEKYLFKGPLTEICFKCHKSFLTDVDGNEKKSIHKPARFGMCYECHEMHFNEKLKMTTKEEIKKKCSRCHEDKAASLHMNIDMACISCHNPHSSDYESLLKSSETGVCEMCHSEILKGEFVHEAMKKPCTYCHGSLHKLKKIDEVKKNCYDCHTEKEHISVAHYEYDISIEKCTICHDPHSAKGRGLIGTVLHMPFFEGDCDACHEYVDNELKLKMEGSYLCYQCHSTKEIFKGKVLLQNMHTPVREGKCTACHDPHAANIKNLLVLDEKVICLNCHKEKQLNKNGKKYLFTHAPIEKEGCIACHETHGSVNKNNLIKDEKDFCFNCHKDLIKKSENAKVIHAPYRENNCKTCHDTHGSDFEHLLNNSLLSICFNCHEFILNNESHIPFRVIHKPVKDGECFQCHDPHLSNNDKRLIMKGNKLCTRCHEELGESHHTLKYASNKKDVIIEKGFLKDGDDFACIGCHSPHATNYKKLFTLSEDFFCSKCHKQKMQP